MNTHSVTLLPADLRFECGEDETILSAALRHGCCLPYGCRKGNCGTCKAQVLEGEVDFVGQSTYALSEFERDQGFTLLCSAYPVADVAVEMEGLELDELDGAGGPTETFGSVNSVVPLTHDIWQLTLEVSDEVSFRAGQFAELNITGSEAWRSYSMSNPPSQYGRMEFMIKLLPNGSFSSCLPSFVPGQRLRLRVPHGSFWVRDHDRPLLLIGGGAGMAPLWSMLQDLAERGDRRPIRFFYGARTGDDLFHVDAIRALAGKLADFEFTAALSHASPEEAAGLPCGLVTDVVERALGRELRRYDAYLCGPPGLIDAAVSMLADYGLEERRSIFYDKFTAS